MNRFRLSIFFLIALLVLCAVSNTPIASAQSAPQASVDRDVVSEGDSLTLTISIDGSSDDAPDFSVLKKDFDVSGSSQNTQHSLINGRISSHTEWETTLIPKHSGALTIPPIAVGAAKTQAIVIQVNAANRNSANDGSEPIFIEAQTDRSSVYVQQQIVFTVRVFVAVQLENMQLTKPEFDNASTKQLSETTYRREVNGTPYEVHELSYAIFPQQPGELTIPELVFSAAEVTQSRSLFDFPGQGRALRRMSKQLSVHVKPIPKTFSGNVWLPARNLTLSESWEGDQQHLAAGTSITRSIAMHADGLLAAQLPALEPVTLDNAKIYADQPTLDDQQDTRGVHGKRVENMTLIPTQAGSLKLPETRVVWWDLDSDSEKVATLNGETLSIRASAAASSAAVPPASTRPSTLPPVANTPIEIPQQNTAPSLIVWQLFSAALLVLWLITLWLYWRARRTASATVATIAQSPATTTLSENAAWQVFIDACHHNEPAAARNALLKWAQLYFARSDLRSVDQLQQISGDALLQRELLLLDNRLFGVLRDSSEWNGENLLQVVKNLKSQASTKNQAATQLPPLYPIG
jgi:hypothetical protein